MKRIATAAIMLVSLVMPSFAAGEGEVSNSYKGCVMALTDALPKGEEPDEGYCEILREAIVEHSRPGQEFGTCAALVAREWRHSHGNADKVSSDASKRIIKGCGMMVNNLSEEDVDRLTRKLQQR